MHFAMLFYWLRDLLLNTNTMNTFVPYISPQQKKYFFSERAAISFLSAPRFLF